MVAFRDDYLEATADQQLAVEDYIIVALVLIGSLLVGMWASRQKNHGGSTAGEGYFLSGRDMPWYLVGASLFASNIGAEHFVGMAGTSALLGISVGLYEWFSTGVLLMLAFIFLPIFTECRLTTIPEYLERRYDFRSRFLVSFICILTYITTKLAGTLYAGTLVLEVFLGIDMFIGALILVALAGVYTITGGLRAVMWTDLMQMVVFLVGGIVAFVVSTQMVTLEDIKFVAENKIFNEDQVIMTEYLHLWRSSGDTEWSGMVFGSVISAIWYWCFDQYIVQRVLASRSIHDGRQGILMTAALKLLPPFLLCIPGVVARTAFEICRVTREQGEQEEPRFEEWCFPGMGDDYRLDRKEGADKAYLYLVLRSFPHGAKGMIIAAMLAAMLSSLSSVFNSASTLFTFDIYQGYYHPKASDRRLTWVGRITVLVLTLASFAWIPVMKASKDGLYLFLQLVSAHFQPGILGVILPGFFFERPNSFGAVSGLVTSLLVGIAHLIVCLVAPPEKQLLSFNHFAAILFLITSSVTISTSLITDPPAPEKIKGLVYKFHLPIALRRIFDREETSPSMNDTKDDSTIKEDEVCKPITFGNQLSVSHGSVNHLVKKAPPVVSGHEHEDVEITRSTADSKDNQLGRNTDIDVSPVTWCQICLALILVTLELSMFVVFADAGKLLPGDSRIVN